MTTKKIDIKKSCHECGYRLRCTRDERNTVCFAWEDERLFALEVAIRALEDLSETERAISGMSASIANEALKKISPIMEGKRKPEIKHIPYRDVCEALDRLKKLDIDNLLRRCNSRAEVEDYTRRLKEYIIKLLEALKEGEDVCEIKTPTKSEKPETIDEWATAVIAHLERDATFREEGIRKHCKWFDISRRAAGVKGWCMHPDIEYQLSHWGVMRQNVGDGFPCMCRLFELDKAAFIERKEKG